MPTEWSDKHPAEPDFLITPSTLFPQALRKYSPASLRALFRLQSGTTPSGPLPSEPLTRCRCGKDQSSLHLLTECPTLGEARHDLLPPAPDPENPEATPLATSFDPGRLPHLITFLRRTVLGFCKDLRDEILTEEPKGLEVLEVDDLDVGPLVGSLRLDLYF